VFLCKVAHGGWFRQSEVLTPSAESSRMWWQIEWGSPVSGPDGECWLRIQSVQNKYDDIPWPSYMCVHAEQALRIMTKYGSAHAFTQQALDAVATVPLLKHDLKTLEETKAQATKERATADSLGKLAIYMMNMFQEFPKTIGRTKHATALYIPLQQMLYVLGTERTQELRITVSELKEPVADKMPTTP
jgi:hypothetical protein